MEWTISAQQGTAYPLAHYGITHLRRVRNGQGRDTVTFRRSAAWNEPCPFSPPCQIRILRDNVPWFCGTLIHAPVDGTAAALSSSYRVAGPWWHLESIVYQQGWRTAANPDESDSELVTVRRSHLILGQGIAGQPISLRSQLVDIFDYAIAAGAPFTYQMDANELGQTFPFDECKDLSCAEAIRRVLQWVPDARLWFDHAADPPILHCTRRSSAEAKTFALAELKSFSLSARHDLQLQGVVLKYERLHHGDNLIWRTVEEDRFPENCGETQPRVLVLTIELAGVRSHYLTQKIQTRTIAVDSAIWWQQHLPALAAIPTASLQILGHSRSSELPRELVEGSIAEWMEVETELDMARATIAYATDAADILCQDVAVPLRATNAVTRTYAMLESFTGEEATPQGLAQLLHENFATVPYAGTISWEDGDVRQISLGWQINLSGGRPEWETMAADIQECVEDVGSGQVTLRLGPPGQPGLRRLIQLARVNRNRGTPRESYVRPSGLASGESLDLPELGPMGHGQLGVAEFGKILLTNGTDPSIAIALDANAIQREGLVLQPREEDVVENGVLKKRLSIASQPYQSGES
ncbi:MAG: hypothetical protein LBP65_01465 [Puniceicoccales bacterium]|jgi:hypothetical protein|nr:hypothetical protein [Puniceicoccales bacterium]